MLFPHEQDICLNSGLSKCELKFIITKCYIFQAINGTYYQLCVKEIHNPNGYDPVKVTALIVGEYLVLLAISGPTKEN